MKRLTIKIDKGYITDDTKCMHNKYIDKLGQLEDVEEELGCPLEVVFKALKNGIWYEDVANRMHCIGVSLDANNYESDFVLNAYTNENAVMVRDYKKTWWLKKDKSE